MSAPVPTTSTTPAVVPTPPEPVVSAPTTTIAAPHAITTAVVTPEPVVSAPTTTVAPSDDAETERLLKELMKKLNKKKKPSEFLAKVAADWEAEEALAQLTPLEIPPRPQTLVEMPTSQALAAQKGNPQITPETLTQEIPPTTQIPHTETQPSTETLEGRGGETQTREGQVGDDAQSTGAGEGEEKNMLEVEEGRKGEEVETAEDGESEGEEVEKNEEREVAKGSGAEKAEGSVPEGEDVEVSKDKEAEGSMSEGEEIEGDKDDETKSTEKVDEEGEEGDDSERELENVEEKEEEVSEGKEEPEKVVEEEQDTGCLNAEEKVETEVVDVDDLPSDDKGTPEDERTMRRHSRRVRNAEEASPASQLRKLKLKDEDESDDDVSQVQETPVGTKDVSPEVLK